MPLIPALGRQRQMDLCEFEDSLVYRASFRQSPRLHRETVSRETNKQKEDGKATYTSTLGKQSH